jgi:serine phosphatase RsbU (regulator of sigma subunit)
MSAPAAAIVVVDPSGHRTRVELRPLPFRIGRQPDNECIIRDTRASRVHARILFEHGHYTLEDLGSLHGTFVNGTRVERHALCSGDRIEIGALDSYQLHFALEGAPLARLVEQFEKPGAAPGVGGNLARLRSILELARTLQGSFSVHDVLNALVDTALAVTGAERGFLLLRRGEDLDMRVARNRQGQTLDEADLRVPRQVIRRALDSRRDLFAMDFDPHGDAAAGGGHSVADLELRSVVCVPLMRIRTGQSDETRVLSSAEETLGALYMDSRAGAADLAGGNRELIQTLAIEASTILENARLLDEERGKRQIEEELRLARVIQQDLLPRHLPSSGWLRAAGASVASREVGGDYFDVIPVHAGCWSIVVADVSGKGVGSALLASLLQGALLSATDRPEDLAVILERLNAFLNARTAGEKYATLFLALIDRAGRLAYVNAAHCPPLLVRAAGGHQWLDATGTPAGLLEGARFGLETRALAAGDKLVLYTDGVTEAQNASGAFFGRRRLRDTVLAFAAQSCGAVHEAVLGAVSAFASGTPQADDVTLLVVEYRPE